MEVTIDRHESSGCHHEADCCWKQCRWRLWFPHRSDAGETIGSIPSGHSVLANDPVFFLGIQGEFKDRAEAARPRS